MKWVFPNMFSNKIKVALNKKVKVNKYLLLLFDSFSFFIFHSLFFNIFLLLLAMSRLFMFFEKICSLFSFLRRALCSTWKKIQVQIILFNKKVFVNIYRISNSKSPPWSLFKLCGNFFLVNVSRWLGQIFLVSTMN